MSRIHFKNGTVKLYSQNQSHMTQELASESLLEKIHQLETVQLNLRIAFLRYSKEHNAAQEIIKTELGIVHYSSERWNG